MCKEPFCYVLQICCPLVIALFLKRFDQFFKLPFAGHIFTSNCFPVSFLKQLKIACRQFYADQLLDFIGLRLAVLFLHPVFPQGMIQTQFRMKVLTELKNRGVQDIYIACVDGLKGFPEAVEALFPKTQVQLCIVHMVRNSLRFVSWEDRKRVVADLKTIYQAATEEQARMHPAECAQKRDTKYPTIATSWQYRMPFFAYPFEIRRMIYTTNASESLNNSLKKKTIKNRASFPNDEAAVKLLYLSLKNRMKKWTMPVQNWGKALNQFAVLTADRMPIS